MKRNLTALVLIVGVAAAALAAARTNNRAEASVGGCFSDTPGPAKPTICE
ncbi:hypothetical protein ACUXST_002467 [Sphingomonas sp. F9_3S_D5_B_2]